jgi:hypothetical protein
MAIDFQGLLNLVTANEKARRFNLGYWWEKLNNGCGTVGCLIGNFCHYHPRDKLVIRGNSPKLLDATFDDANDGCWAQIAARFGITKNESEWMFGAQEITSMDSVLDWMNAIAQPGWDGCFDLFDGEGRDCENKAAAIARVRKFIYYKLHKQEMLYEADGRVKESARRAEGDHHVIRKVLEKV